VLDQPEPAQLSAPPDANVLAIPTRDTQADKLGKAA
jgi:hypothetical protein